MNARRECCDQFESILDAHTGDEICLSCGQARVYLFHADDYIPPPSLDIEQEEKRKEKEAEKEQEGSSSSSSSSSCRGANHLIRELIDIAANKNVSQAICSTATELLEKKLKKRKKKTAHRALAAHCLYLAFYMHDVPRSLKELSTMYRVSAKAIGRYEETKNRQTDSSSSSLQTLKPSHLVERTLSGLNIDDVSMINQVKTLSDSLYENQLNSVSPQSALAVSVALTFPQLALASIAEQCQISRQTVAKHLHNLNNHRTRTI